MPFIGKSRPRKSRPPTRSVRPGYSLIELLVAVAILGIILAFAFPSFNNSQSVRALDNEAGTIVMAIQTAKWRAATTGISHRLRFVSTDSSWAYRIERETVSGTWTLLPGTNERGISGSFGITVNLPTSLDVVFRPTGLVSNYETGKNTITLTSAKLQNLGEPGQRTILLYAGGSVRLAKS